MNLVSSLQRYSSAHFGVIAAVVYLALSAVKMRTYLAHGRFWAEEGKFFYPDIASGDILGGVFYLFHGHLELITNIIIFISAQVDLKHAPLITTYGSFAAQALPIFFLIRYRKVLSLTRLGTLLVIALAVGMPQAPEVWANSINLHFHFALLAALIAATPPDDGPPKWISRLLLAMSGLSGVPSNFLVPIFAALAIKTRQPERWVQFLILSMTAVLQIFLLLLNHSDTGSRDYFSSPLSFWLAPVAQSVIAPFFGFPIGEQLAQVLRDALRLKTSSLLFAIFLSIPLIHFFAIWLRNKFNTTGVIISSAFVLLFMSTLTALGNKEDLISVIYSGRYFYATNVLLFIAFFASIRQYSIHLSIIVFVLAISLLTNVKKSAEGPNWEASFNFSKAQGSSAYNIWPNGWSMVLKNQ